MWFFPFTGDRSWFLEGAIVNGFTSAKLGPKWLLQEYRVSIGNLAVNESVVCLCTDWKHTKGSQDHVFWKHCWLFYVIIWSSTKILTPFVFYLLIIILYRWIEGDALDLPFPDGYFDAITMGYGLRNVVDKQRAMKEMFRVLKRGLMSIIPLSCAPWRCEILL